MKFISVAEHLAPSSYTNVSIENSFNLSTTFMQKNFNSSFLHCSLMILHLLSLALFRIQQVISISNRHNLNSINNRNNSNNLSNYNKSIEIITIRNNKRWIRIRTTRIVRHLQIPGTLQIPTWFLRIRKTWRAISRIHICTTTIKQRIHRRVYLKSYFPVSLFVLHIPHLKR